MDKKQLNVLLIEDNPGDARLIAEYLKEFPGSEVKLEIASNMLDGLKCLARSKMDIILLDLSLPDSQGIDTFKKVQNHSPDVPIILLTGLDDEKFAFETLQQGAQDYLVKGLVDGQLLSRTLRYAIGRKRAEKAFHLVLKVTMAANEADDVDSVIQFCLDNICDYTGWPVGHAYYFDKADSNELLPTKIWHLENPEHFTSFRGVTEETRFAPGIGLPGRVLDSSEPAWIVDVARDSNFPRAKMAQDIGVKAGFAFPVLVGNEIVAVLEFFSRDAIPPNLEILTLMRQVGVQLGLVIERTRVKVELAASEIRLSGILDISPDAIISVNAAQTIVLFNKGAEAIFGYSAEEVFGRQLELLLPNRLRDAHRKHFEEFNNSPDVSRTLTNRMGDIKGMHKDGSEFPAVASISKLDLGSEKIFTVALRDITDEQEAEKQLRQAQKMEAVGQLTGGIAHDFNNLLTVILGNLQMLDEQFTADDDSRQMTTTALKAVFRGADLTKRLLTFSRQQILEPIVIDINQLVWKMNDLIRRTLGGAIEVKTNFADELWPTMLDPGQLENSLLNLSINARDAMPDGGMLTLETANIQLDEHYCAKHSWVSPGDYVMLAVSDVGEGIAPEIQDRVFEPFFTTKDTGRGSGLGLSMVYGFVKQSGGHVNIYSEQGHGTTVKLYFPKTKTRQAVTEAQAELEVTPRGNETILVVEDDIDVRRTATILLKMLGYRVLEAENGRTALAVIEQHEEIDLMFTDVVMQGGMKGPEVVARARQIRPHLKALLTSGYTQSAMQNDDMSDSDIAVLSKPYNKNDLALKIRKVLDGK